MCAHVRKDPRRLRPSKREKKKKQVRPPLTEIMKIRKPTLRFYVKMIITLWKFHDFAVTQILREIKIGESLLRMLILPILGAKNLVNFARYQPPKSAKIHKNQTSKPINVLKLVDFDTLESPILFSCQI